MFMRFRGGGVGRIGTRYLGSRVKDDNNESSHEHQDDSEERIADLYEDSDSYWQEERGDGVDSAVEEDNGRHEEHISRRKPSNEDSRKLKMKMTKTRTRVKTRNKRCQGTYTMSKTLRMTWKMKRSWTMKKFLTRKDMQNCETVKQNKIDIYHTACRMSVFCPGVWHTQCQCEMIPHCKQAN